MIRVFDLPADDDLLPFSAFLWDNQIPHRITEEGGRQVFWLQKAEDFEAVKGYYTDWRAGLLKLGKVKVAWSSGALFAGPLADWKRIPVTLLLIAVCLVVAAFSRLGADFSFISHLTFSNFAITGEMIRFPKMEHVFDSGEYWRVLTPIFLHFGWLHLIFNMLWLLDFGRRLEMRHKAYFLLGLVVLTGLVSNVVQYITADGYPLFGGMSGVIYGLLGFCWIREKKHPGMYQVPPGIYMFMLAWLVIGFTGVLGAFGFGTVANAAHAGGLFAGVCAGMVINRFADDSQ